MSDYLLNDIMRGILLLFVLWSVAAIWLMLGGFRFMTRQQKRIDSLRAEKELFAFENDNLREENAMLKYERRMAWPSLSEQVDILREANEVLHADLEQCYARLPSQEWLDVLKFGDSDPRRGVVP
jgi:hypothetical protein